MFAKINSTKYDNIIFNESFVKNDTLEKMLTVKFTDYQSMKNAFQNIISIEGNIEIQIFTSEEKMIDNFRDEKEKFVISNVSVDDKYGIYLSLLTSIKGVNVWE